MQAMQPSPALVSGSKPSKDQTIDEPYDHRPCSKHRQSRLPFIIFVSSVLVLLCLVSLSSESGRSDVLSMLLHAHARLGAGFRPTYTRNTSTAHPFTSGNSQVNRVALQHGPEEDACTEVCMPPDLTAPALASGRARSLVRTHAQTSTAQVAVEEEPAWWKKDKDLWTEVHTEEEFAQLTSSGDRIVAVEFFAPWCAACQTSYPTVCRTFRAEPALASRFKLVKACVEEFKTLCKREGVIGMPNMAFYLPGRGRLVTISIGPSKAKKLRQNLQFLLDHIDEPVAFGTDPNGFITITGPLEGAELREIKKKAAAAELESSKGGLFDHLMRIAGKASHAAPASNMVATTPLMSNNKSTSTSSISGSVNALAAPAVATIKASTSSTVGTAAELRLSCPSGCDAEAYAHDKAAFLARWGKEYGYGGQIETLYPKELGSRLPPGHHYLDYTASSVYTNTQLAAVFGELQGTLFGNPHSASPSSTLTSNQVDAARLLVLRHFNADPAEYQVVFTRSATGAIKMVGETFPWSSGSAFRYLRENHNSVLGVREYALERGGTFLAMAESRVEAWLSGDRTAQHDPSPAHKPGQNESTYSLFAFPAEDNFAGVKYPLDWVRRVHARSTSDHRWLVMLDAAAYVPTQPLDLSATPADFVDISFYKLFGYPTGLGALLVRTSVVPLMRKVFWGGGTVALATSEDNFHVLKCSPTDKLEDGTVSFLDIVALKHGFGLLASLGGVKHVQAHVHALTAWAYERLSSLRHSNGAPLVAIFGKHGLSNAREVQGGIINFEVLRPDGGVVSYKRVEREAAAAGFHVRTGAECNPGACYNYLGVCEAEVEGLAGVKEGCEDDVEFVEVQRPMAPASNDSTHTLTAGDFLRCIHAANDARSSAPDHSCGPRTGASTNAAASAAGSGPSSEACTATDAVKGSSVTVSVPLGSVRASLGYMSTFEDVYALSAFMERTYKDCTQY